MKTIDHIVREQKDVAEIELLLRQKFQSVREFLHPQIGVPFCDDELERVHFHAVAHVFAVLSNQPESVSLMEQLYPSTYSYALMMAVGNKVKSPFRH